jgi:hypothetical protein
MTSQEIEASRNRVNTDVALPAIFTNKPLPASFKIKLGQQYYLHRKEDTEEERKEYITEEGY